MKMDEVVRILDAKVYAGKDLLDTEVFAACGSDLMSDVLAFSKDHSVLITGLCNPQVIRTAEMLDIVCLIFVRSCKYPGNPHSGNDGYEGNCLCTRKTAGRSNGTIGRTGGTDCFID